MHWIYILECADGSYYTGSTTDLGRRLQEHNRGKGSKYTRGRRPVRLVYSIQFETLAEAYRIEKQVKSWNRAKRQALIRGEFELLSELAKPRRQKRDSG